jgi:hypothetical protein
MIKLNQELKNMIIIYFLGLLYATILVIYRLYYNTEIKMLKKEIFYKCNSWCIVHFIHYIVLAFFAPSYWWLLIIIGFLFEIFEWFLSILTIHIDYKIIADTLTNALGVFVGLGLRKIIYK